MRPSRWERRHSTAATEDASHPADCHTCTCACTMRRITHPHGHARARTNVGAHADIFDDLTGLKTLDLRENEIVRVNCTFPPR